MADDVAVSEYPLASQVTQSNDGNLNTGNNNNVRVKSQDGETANPAMESSCSYNCVEDHINENQAFYATDITSGSTEARGPPRQRNNNARDHFEYQKDFPITRFSRKWRRQEVQGLCCLTVEVICLVTLAVLSLQGMGYFGNLGEDGHVPHSFSWKILREFFTYEEIPPNTKECLYFLRGGNSAKRIRGHIGARFLKNVDEDDMDYNLIDVFNNNNNNQGNTENEIGEDLPQPQPENFNANTHVMNSKQCDYKKSRRSTEWLLKMFSANFMSILNTITSALFFSSIGVRRRKGLQVILLIPSFLCFFMSIFQQIPTTFHYNYVNLLLRDEMRTALAQSSPPHFITPVLEETQIHMQCCGIDHPSSWENQGSTETTYPGSCCNTTAFDCAGKLEIDKHKVWSAGCFYKQYEKIHSFERWSLFILGFKIIAEIGIFCALSDLTRFDYPPPEVTENSRCEFRDYLVKCKGVARIRGVTKDARVVVDLNVLFAWRLVPSRTDMVNGLQLILKNDLNQVKGSVEVMTRINAANFLHEDIQVDLTRKTKGIYVFTLL